ncbi:MAG: carboxypeptidase regulatory-like domain-containing protein [Acidobacteriota bacterium]
MRDGLGHLARLSVLLSLVALPAAAQEITTGAIAGRVRDPAGQPIPGALVIAVSRHGTRTAETDIGGRFVLPFLRPGLYSVRVEASRGFNTLIQKHVKVGLSRRTTLDFTLAPGRVESVRVTAAAPLVDVKSTSTGSNIRYAEFAESVPLGRSFTDTILVAPGVVSGIGTGRGNYSIGGASGLENTYLIDGVNITNTGYGGIGSYNILYGSLGTGVTSEFLDEVQIKTGGFEAEHGQALGGIINTIVRSGTNDVKGSVAWFSSPAALRSPGRLVELDVGASNVVDEQVNDLAFSLGGPIVEDRAFYFLAYNPVITTREVRAQALPDPAFQAASAGLAAFDETTTNGFDAPAALAFPSAAGDLEGKRVAHNYAAKFTWQAAPNHQLELTLFGDPAEGRDGPQRDMSGSVGQALNQQFDLGGGASRIRYGSHNQALKWSAVFAPRFFMEAQLSHHDGRFRETSTLNASQYTDLRNTLEFIRGADSFDPGTGAVPLQVTPVASVRGGVGAIIDQDDEDLSLQVKFTNLLGRHEIKYGVQYDEIEYRDLASFTGASIDIGLPLSSAGTTTPVDDDGDGLQDLILSPTNGGVQVSVRNLTGDPSLAYDTANLFRVTRASIGPRPDTTRADEISLFLQDTWSVRPRLTIKAGVRWTEETVGGGGTISLPFGTDSVADPFSGIETRIFTCTPDGSGGCLESTTFTPSEYTFSHNWAPRLGVVWDALGNGRSRLWANWARYFQRVSNNLAVRAFSNEVLVAFQEFDDRDLTSHRYFPFAVPCVDSTGGGAGTCQVAAPVSVTGLEQKSVAPGTKLPYEDELSGGFAFEVTPESSFEVRAIYRKQGRVLEDVQTSAIEQIQNFYYGYAYGYPYDPFGGSPTPGGEISATFPAASFGALTVANPGSSQDLGGRFGFPKPERIYRALELVYTRWFSDNWSLFANFRYARLEGNYEGLFRNDNGQSDPNNSSLYDFPNSALMSGQFASGPLPTDVARVLRVFPSYTLSSGLRIGAGLSWSSGVPRTSLLAHPLYQNAGEIPGIDPVYAYWVDPVGLFNPADFRLRKTSDLQAALTDPEAISGAAFLFDYSPVDRGNLGRTPDLVTLDLHADLPIHLGGTRLRLFLDVFNVFDEQEATRFNDSVEFTTGVLNPDFLKPLAYQPPRSWRLGMRWDF